MKKFINKVDDILVESLSGFATAHADLVALNLNPNFLTRKNKAHNKVAIISGGGSGHEPLHAGYIGVGMLDAACPGRHLLHYPGRREGGDHRKDRIRYTVAEREFGGSDS